MNKFRSPGQALTGDANKNFPVVGENEVAKVGLVHRKRRKTIEFLFYDGKILQGSYKEFDFKE